MTPTPARPPSISRDLRAILAITGRRRRLQLAATIILMLAGAVSELATMGAVIPLIAFAAGSEYAGRLPGVHHVLDAIGTPLGGDPVIPAAILLIAAVLVSAAVRLSLGWMTQKFVYGFQYDLAMAVFGRMLRQPYEAFVRRNSSSAISGFGQIYQVVVGIISKGLIGFTSAGIALFIIAFLFLIDPMTAAVAAFSMGLLYAFITVTTRRVVRHISKRAAIIRTARIKLLQESLGGLRDIILDRSEGVFERKLAGYEGEMRRLQALSNFAADSPRILVESAGITLVALFSIYFSLRPGGIVAALPVLAAFAVGAQRLLPLLQAIYTAWTNYSVNAHSVRDVAALLEMPADPARDLPRSPGTEPFRDAITLRSVSFSYSGKTRALADIDLTVRKGERIALVGRTGSGKSTLVDLLMGLLRPTTGEMLLDGRPVDDKTLGDWQAQIAHVPQSIFLADASIAANIAFGADGQIEMDRVWKVARQADLADFILDLPEQMDTEVGERGIRLSGGQRQRIGIARALYKRASVLILDEATSALDDRTEAKVLEALNGLDGNLTIIIIAHRLSTIAGCAKIYELDSGRIVQRDSFGAPSTAPINR